MRHHIVKNLSMNLFRLFRLTNCTANQGVPAARKAQCRPNLGVEVLESRLVPTTTPIFTLALVPASASVGSHIEVEVVEHGGTGINNNVVAPNAAVTAKLFFTTNHTAVPLGTVSVLDGIGFAAVQLPTTPAAGEIFATTGSILGEAPITITPGPVTTLVLNAPNQATAGIPFKVTVTAEDGFGNTVTSDTQVPTLNVSMGTPPSVTRAWSNGVLTATVSANSTGLMFLNAVAGSIVTNPSPIITVIPATVTHFVITPFAANVTSGVPSFGTITAEDASGNPVTIFNQNPTFTAGYGFPVSVTTFGWSQGRATFQYTLTSPGTTTLTATLGSATGTTQSINVAATMWGPPNWWAGYEIAGLSNVTAVGATWTQPTDPGPNKADSLIWVGIDGDGSSTVEQCGTKMYMVNGQAHYVAWYELFGDTSGTNSGPDENEVYIPNFTVNPGDLIHAEVAFLPTTTNSYEFQIIDQPANGGPLEVFTLVQTPEFATPARTSAEWIVENDDVRPASQGGQPLANFGQVSFTGVWAETAPTSSQGTTVGSIYSFPGAQAVDMFNSAGNVVALTGGATISNLPGTGESVGGSSSSFTVIWEPGNGVALPPPGFFIPAMVGSNGVGSNANIGVSSSSFTAAAASANGVAATAPSILNPATGHGSGLGTNTTADALVDLDWLDYRLGSTAALDALFTRDVLGNKP